MRDRRLLVGVGAIFALALALRLGPLVWSPLPFNPDGIGYAALTRDVLDAGQFTLGEMATDQVGYTAFLAVISALVGDAPLLTAQPASAVVGASSVLVGVILARRLALGANLSPSRARLAALLAGLFLSLEGIYLYRSMPTDEQTAGLLLVPLFVLAVDYWLQTGRKAWAALSIVLVAPIPPLHNLTGLVAVVAVSVIAVVTIVRSPSWTEVSRAVGTTLGAWLYILGYHILVARFTGAQIVQADRLVRVPDLFLAWLILAIAGTVWYFTTSRRLQRGAVLGMFVSMFGLVALNAVQPVFPSTTPTSRRLLLWLLPLALPAVLAGLAAHLAPRNARLGATTVALIAGPLAIVGTGFTARLTFEYLAMIFRSHLFMHVPLLALAGVGVVLATRQRSGLLGAAVILAVIASIAVTAPIAYAGLDLLSYKSVTTEAEFAATEFATTELDSWTTDDHLARLTGYHQGGGGSRGPSYRWLRGDAPPPACPVLAQRSWTTTGAQFYPQQPAVLSDQTYRNWRARNNVVYVAVNDDPLSVVTPRTNSSRSC